MMSLIWGRTSAGTLLGRVGALFLTLFLLELSVAEVAFQFIGDGQQLTAQGPVLSGNNLTFVAGGNSGDMVNDRPISFGYTDGNYPVRCFYNTPVQMLEPASAPPSFSTMFHVRISNGPLGTLQGLAFTIGNDNSSLGEAGGFLGWLNSTTNDQVEGRNFAVELDFFQDLQFADPPGVHIGVDRDSLTSIKTSTIDGLSNAELERISKLSLTMWIEYNGTTQILDVFITWSDEVARQPGESKPAGPIVSTAVDLTYAWKYSPGGVYVGFAASISNGNSSDSGYDISEWTFISDGIVPNISYPNSSLSPTGSPWQCYYWVRVPKKYRTWAAIQFSNIIIIILIILSLLFIIRELFKRIARLAAIAKKYEIEEGVLDERGPQGFTYNVLSRATKGFSPTELLGSGGFGSVYKGSLALKKGQSPTDIAVKRMSATSNQGVQEFLAEIKIIGQARHRNLVKLLGWCHERAELMLVYDYMPNGSVHGHLYKTTVPGDDQLCESVLTWVRRLKILSGVAAALAYLHEDWEQRVIHRDVKSSNVMLDGDFNARLGDFGLARLSEHDQAPPSTSVYAGTYGYLAPELHQTLKPTEKTDMYSFGALVLEVATGRRPLLCKEDREASDETFLVDWVWGLYKGDALLTAADCNLLYAYDPGEMEMVLKIGLLCSHPNPDQRPDMREVINIWKGSREFPPLPRAKPVPVFAMSTTRPGSDTNERTGSEFSTSLSGHVHRDVTPGHSILKSFPSDRHDHSTLTVPSEHDADFAAGPRHEGLENGYSPNQALRSRRPRTPKALPF